MIKFPGDPSQVATAGRVGIGRNSLRARDREQRPIGIRRFRKKRVADGGVPTNVRAEIQRPGTTVVMRVCIWPVDPERALKEGL